MKKLLLAIAAISMIAITACTPAQEVAIARQLGTAAAVTWIGVDNPLPSDIAVVKEVVTVIRDLCCTNCAPTQSYYTSIYPMIDQYITAKVPANKQPMARLASAFLLTSLDTAMAMNPKWGENADKAKLFVGAFCDGAIVGLSMAPTDPVIQAATRQTAVRLKMKTR